MPPASLAGRRASARPATLALVLLLGVTLLGAGCSSSASDTASSTTTTTAAEPTGKKAKAPVEFASAPKGPVGPDSTPNEKCFAIKAFRYLSAMPDSGRFFKDKLAASPKDADKKIQALARQLEAALPDLASILTTQANDAHARLVQDPPPSGLEVLKSASDKKLISYLADACTTKATA